MNEPFNDTGPATNLERYTEDELRAVIAQAQGLLTQREEQRKKQALEEIQRIAKANGLTVSVTGKVRRGRPPKTAKK